MSITKIIKSKKRVTDYGEVYTSEKEVNAMLDLVHRETMRIDSRFFEPTCGTGNFLAEILERKLTVVERRYSKNQLEYERYAILALSSIYGVDILQDNVQECRDRLFEIFKINYIKHYKNTHRLEILSAATFLLSRNILWGDALSLKTPDKSMQPIVFSEWSLVKGSMIKRRDFTMANLLESQPLDGLNLFSDLGDKAFIPKPVADYPVVHLLKIGDDYGK